MRMAVQVGIIFLGVFVGPLFSQTPGSVSAHPAAAPAGVQQEMFGYRFENGNRGYSDLLTLADGSKRTGKVLEWANRILLFDKAGRPARYLLSSVTLFETRRGERHNSKPALPDLTVAYIERLPRDPSWHGHVVTRDGLSRLDVDPQAEPRQPAVGSRVTFRIHVRNVGAAPSIEAACRVFVDDRHVTSTKVRPLGPGEEQVIEAGWAWRDGPHRIKVTIDEGGESPEIVRWNNTFVEPIHALGVSVVVARDRYEAFTRTPNLLDSFCFEDFIQYHIRNLNALFALSVYPSSPQGVLERVRCDRIIVVDDPSDQETWASRQAELRRGGRADGLAEYAALLTLGKLHEDEDIRFDALKVNWSLLQEMGRQIGLADVAAADTSLEQCRVLDQHERFAQRRHLSPWIRSLMYTAAGFPLAEHDAAFLNRTLGRPRGLRGDYLYQVPHRIVLELVANDGSPLANVRVDAFQRKAEGPDAGTVVGLGRGDPFFSTISDDRGRAPLASMSAPSHKTPEGYELRPNPFGKIATDGSNGLLLLRLRSENAEEFHFLPLSVCNIAYLRGDDREYIHRIQTRFGGPHAPPPPPYVVAQMPDRTGKEPPLRVVCRFPKGLDPQQIEEFRIYKRTSFAGESAKPWTLSTVARPFEGQWPPPSEETYFDEFQYDGPYAPDTFFAASLVDKQGRESSLSAPTFLAHRREAVGFAISGMSAYMTLRGDGAARMLYWDGVAGTQPYTLRTDRIRGYEPHFAGIAFSPDSRMFAADPVQHVLAVCDVGRHELIDVIPSARDRIGKPGSAPGRFSEPTDVAIDKLGNLYVADSGNHRIQILDSRGRFRAILDEDYRFRRPHAVGYANGHLCVTDKNGTRCRVYDVEQTPPRFLRELPLLFDADRALVNTKGKIFVTGRASQDGPWTVLVFAPNGESATFETTKTKGQMGLYYQPRGLYHYTGLNGRFAYFVNRFPFDVRRVRLEE